MSNNDHKKDLEFRAAVKEHFRGGLLNPTMVGEMEKATDEVIASVGVDKLKEMIAAKIKNKPTIKAMSFSYLFKIKIKEIKIIVAK